MGGVTCSHIEDLAVPFNVLRDDVAQVGPVLVPVEFSAVSVVGEELLGVALLPEGLLAVVAVLFKIHNLNIYPLLNQCSMGVGQRDNIRRANTLES